MRKSRFIPLSAPLMLFLFIPVLVAAGANEEMIKTHIEALDDSDCHNREFTIEKLMGFGDSAVSLLIEALNHRSPRVRFYAAYVLGSFRNSRAVKPLMAALKNENPDIRENAASMLGQMGDLGSVEPLVAALGDENDQVRWCAAGALRNMGWRPENDARKVQVFIAAKEWNACARMGEPGMAALLSLLLNQNEGGYDRANVAAALGGLDDSRVDEALLIALGDREDIVRAKAAAVLDARGWKPDRVDLKMKRLIAKKRWSALVEIGEPAVDPLIALLDDPDWEPRKNAAEALGKIGNGRAAGPLVRAMRNSNVRSAAEDALVNIGPSSTDPVIKGLEDSNSGVRLSAYRILGKLGWKPGDDPIRPIRDKNRRRLFDGYSLRFHQG